MDPFHTTAVVALLGIAALIAAAQGALARSAPDRRDHARRARRAAALAALEAALIAAAAAVTALTAPLGLPALALAAALAVALPRIVTAHQPDPGGALVHTTLWIGRVADPLTVPLHAAAALLARAGGMRITAEIPVSEADVRSAVASGAAQGAIEQDEHDMLRSVLELGETDARAIMVPRTDMVAIEASASLREGRDLAVQSGHSRIPVYSGSIDDVRGVLYAKDLLRADSDDDDLDRTTVGEVMRPAHFVPATKRVDALLRELQQANLQMAVAIDEYGGVAGLLTVEDCVEEIVGEIRDEFETGTERQIGRISDDELLVDARARIDDVRDHCPDLGIDDAPDYTTVGGLLASVLGRMPASGDHVRHAGWDMTVEPARRPRQMKVRMRRIAVA